MNYTKTALLLAAMTALFMTVGYVTAGQGGMLVAFLFAVATNLFAYWNADKMVLRMHGAQPVTAAQSPELYKMVERLAGNARLPMPKVYIMHNPQPNAFATGRNPQNAVVAVTTGLLELLDTKEIEGVVAHELAHIDNRDTLIMTLTATIAGAVSMLANFALFFGGRDSRNSPFGILGTLAMVILAPLAAMLVQMAISRTREYAADKRGAQICGHPLSLASALRKIASGVERVESVSAERNPATAHMFIINPLSGARMDRLFSTHPDTVNRIAALEALAEEMGMASDAEQARRTPAGPWSGVTGHRTGGRPNGGPWG